MKSLIETILLPLVTAAAMGLFGAAPAQAQACLDNRAIQQAVASGEIMSLAAVLSEAGVQSDTDILSVQVCDEGGRLVYVIGVLGPTGEARNMVLSAR